MCFSPLPSDLVIESCRAQRTTWPAGDNSAAIFCSMPLNRCCVRWLSTSSNQVPAVWYVERLPAVMGLAG